MTKQYKSFTLPLASCTNPKDYKTLQIVWTQLKNIWVKQVWPEHTLMTQETSKGTLKGAWWKTYTHKTQIKGRSNWGPAGGSSHLDPFSLEHVDPRSDRSVVTSGGVMDRDDVASLNLASRKSTRACRALKRKTGSPVKMGGQGCLSRDRRKVTATPKRARPVSGRTRVRCLVSFKSGGLRSVIVAVDCGSALDHNGLVARISLEADPRWVCDDTA